MDKTDEKHDGRGDIQHSNFMQPRQSLYQQPNGMQSEYDILNMQSIIDPDKKSMLMNYGLDNFKNSIWENFLGS